MKNTTDKPTAPPPIGQQIAARRRELSLSQEECARRIGVSANTWPRWEQGVRAVDVPTLCRIADVLGVSFTLGAAGPVLIAPLFH